ncbi:EamA family transporter [Paraconexibacter sp.]|uniref:EamA family transporter n=1 Tax=Paraconexibacter sp. TaxID=2949640 RepID=UPI00356A7AF1
MAAGLALLASLAYGVSNFAGPRLARDVSLFLLLLVGQTCSLLLAGVVVAVQGEGLPDAEAIGFALLAGFGNAGGLVLFYRAAAVGPLSIVTPIGSLGAAVPVAIGIAGGEAMTVLKGLGILLALTGVVLVARRPGADLHDEKHSHRRAAVVLAALSAVCFGVFLAAIAPAAEDAAGWAVLLSRVSLVAVLATFVVRLGVFRELVPRRMPVLAVPGLLLFAGTMAYAIATREGDLSVVSVLGSLFPVVTVGLAVGLDGERLRRPQAIGALATIAGVVLLSMR